jgi:hypothetical protein
MSYFELGSFDVGQAIGWIRIWVFAKKERIKETEEIRKENLARTPNNRLWKAVKRKSKRDKIVTNWRGSFEVKYFEEMQQIKFEGFSQKNL